VQGQCWTDEVLDEIVATLKSYPNWGIQEMSFPVVIRILYVLLEWKVTISCNPTQTKTM